MRIIQITYYLSSIFTRYISEQNLFVYNNNILSRLKVMITKYRSRLFIYFLYSLRMVCRRECTLTIITTAIIHWPEKLRFPFLFSFFFSLFTVSFLVACRPGERLIYNVILRYPNWPLGDPAEIAITRTCYYIISRRLKVVVNRHAIIVTIHDGKHCRLTAVKFV